jgi:predicted nucleic acid-binding Zn ribbon protein
LVGERWEGVVVRAKYLKSEGPKEPEEISTVLAAVIEKAAVGVDMRHGHLVNEWASVVPQDWARFGTPVGVKAGILLVEVPDGSAASLLKYQIEDLKRVLADRFGADVITGIRLRVA